MLTIRRSTRILVALMAISCLALLNPARGCNVPVFRYALEYWSTEPYELFVFHESPFTPDQTELLEALQAAEHDPSSFANVRCLPVTISELPPVASDIPNEGTLPPARNPSGDPLLTRAARIWSIESGADTPRAVLIAPHNTDRDPVWTGPFNRETVDRLLSSPARLELSSRILNGESAVWVLLESGIAELDDRTALELERNLKAAEASLKLPPPAPDDPQIHAELPLRIAFSVLRISRTDPAEQILVRALLNGEPELSSTPVAFPVFGQGRALAAITAADLTPRVVQEASAFITGPCSCEVKDLNPGKDLLLAANWTSIFGNPAQRSPAPPNLEASSPASPVKKRLLITAASLVFLVGIGATIILGRGRAATS